MKPLIRTAIDGKPTPRGYHNAIHQEVEYWVLRGYWLDDCPGEAHKAYVLGNIDNCSRCAPMWGVIAVKAE